MLATVEFFEGLKAFVPVLTPIASVVTSVVAVTLVVLRNKDKKANTAVTTRLEDIHDKLDCMPRIVDCLETISRKYQLNVTHEQAVNLLDITYTTARLNIKCWVCRYISAGHPDFNQGKWNIDNLMRGEYYATTNRLGPFSYEGLPMDQLILKSEFDWFRNELKDVIHKYDHTVDASERVSSEIERMIIRSKQRMSKEVVHDD